MYAPTCRFTGQGLLHHGFVLGGPTLIGDPSRYTLCEVLPSGALTSLFAHDDLRPSTDDVTCLVCVINFCTARVYHHG